MILSAIVMLPLALPYGLLPTDADTTALYALLAIVVAAPGEARVFQPDILCDRSQHAAAWRFLPR